MDHGKLGLPFFIQLFSMVISGKKSGYNDV